jgi:hypothetical protein
MRLCAQCGVWRKGILTSIEKSSFFTARRHWRGIGTELIVQEHLPPSRNGRHREIYGLPLNRVTAAYNILYPTLTGLTGTVVREVSGLSGRATAYRSKFAIEHRASKTGGLGKVLDNLFSNDIKYLVGQSQKTLLITVRLCLNDAHRES